MLKYKKWQEQVDKFKLPAPKISLDSLNINLRPYQKEGAQWLNKLFHWGLGACG